MRKQFKPLTESEIIDALEKIEAFADSTPCWKAAPALSDKPLAVIGNGLYVRVGRKREWPYAIPPSSLFRQPK